MLKKIGLIVVLLALGASCSKKKNKEFQINLKKATSEMQFGKTGDGTSAVEEEQAGVAGEEEISSEEEASDDSGISTMVKAFVEKIEGMKAENADLTIDSDAVVFEINNLTLDIQDLFQELIDQEKVKFSIAFDKIEELESPLEEKLSNENNVITFVKNVEVLGVKNQLVVTVAEVISEDSDIDSEEIATEVESTDEEQGE